MLAGKFIKEVIYNAMELQFLPARLSENGFLINVPK